MIGIQSEHAWHSVRVRLAFSQIVIGIQSNEKWVLHWLNNLTGLRGLGADKSRSSNDKEFVAGDPRYWAGNGMSRVPVAVL